MLQPIKNLISNHLTWETLVDLGKLSETEAAAFATAAENLSRVTPRVKKPRGRRCCCLNPTTSLVLNRGVL